MAVTSPDNIWTPDAGDDYALTTDLASTADSVQDALNAVRGDNRAFSGLEGDRPAPGVEGRTWYSTDTNRSWFDTGANWISNDGGLYLIRPTGTIGSGVSIGADGTVNFSSAASTGAGFSGAFTTRFKSYEIHYGLTHANSNLQMRMGVGSSAVSTSNYVSSGAYITGTVVTAVSTTTTAAIVNQVQSTSHAGSIDIFDPADPSKNTSFNARGTAQELYGWGGGWFNTTSAHDGLVFFPGAGVVFSGWAKVYGRA